MPQIKKCVLSLVGQVYDLDYLAIPDSNENFGLKQVALFLSVKKLMGLVLRNEGVCFQERKIVFEAHSSSDGWECSKILIFLVCVFEVCCSEGIFLNKLIPRLNPIPSA